MTIELTPVAEEALGRITSMSDLSKGELIEHALMYFASRLQFETQLIEKSMACIERGEYREHNEVFEELERRYVARQVARKFR